jgi:hypothetical protein
MLEARMTPIRQHTNNIVTFFMMRTAAAQMIETLILDWRKVA